MTIHDMGAMRLDTFTPVPTKSVLLLDTDRNILRNLTDHLQAEGFKVDAYTDANAAQSSLRRKRPDLAVFNAKLPQMGGFELLQRLRGQSDHLPVVMMNDSESTIDEEVALRIGADDYLRKPVEPRIMVERIKACLRRVGWDAETDKGKGKSAPLRIAIGPLTMDEQRHEVTWKGQIVGLTATEFSVLGVLAKNVGHVKSRDQLLDHVYGTGVYVEDRSIDSHIKRVRNKMRKVDRSFSAIETLYGIGYRLDIADIL